MSTKISTIPLAFIIGCSATPIEQPVNCNISIPDKIATGMIADISGRCSAQADFTICSSEISCYHIPSNQTETARLCYSGNITHLCSVKTPRGETLIPACEHESRITNCQPRR